MRLTLLHLLLDTQASPQISVYNDLSFKAFFVRKHISCDVLKPFTKKCFFTDLKENLKMSKNKTTTVAISLFLMFAIAISLIAIPAANAQGTWSIYCSTRARDGRVRGEVRLDGSRQREPFSGAMCGVMIPGATDWTYYGPFDTTSGRFTFYFADWTEYGDYQFQWIVPPSGSLPVNPDTPDGNWYSNIGTIEYELQSKATYAYIGATPNPVQVGQPTLLHMGITEAIGRIGDGWEGLSVTIERPDGETDTIDNIRTDSTGGTGRMYVPDMAGEYIVQTHFPEQLFGIMTYLASDSPELTLVAQEEPLTFYPGHALPTEYWTRPIDSQIREWYPVGGSWLVRTPANKFVPYNAEAPDTAHILWTKPFITGGLVGGDLALESSINAGPVGFETGDAYQGKWSSRFIISGKLIYTHHTSVRPLEYTCVDVLAILKV